MTASSGNALPSDVERDLVGELAQAALRRVAPEELAVFEETEADYFRDPESFWHARRRDEAVGFGLELALLTPYVLAVGTAVVRFLASTLTDAVRDELRDELKPVIADSVRRLFWRGGRPGDSHPDGPGHDMKPGLTAAQGREVREVALQQASRLGLGEEQASLLADAVVGSLLVDG
jgi:hypothetical protein